MVTVLLKEHVSKSEVEVVANARRRAQLSDSGGDVVKDGQARINSIGRSFDAQVDGEAFEGVGTAVARVQCGEGIW